MKTETHNFQEINREREGRYLEALANLPPSGGGGAHAAILSIANLGRIAGLPPEQIERDIAAHWHGSRRPTKTEIPEAVSKAFASVDRPHIVTSRPSVDGEKLLAAILRRGADFTEADLFEASPVRLDWEPERDPVEILQRLYSPQDKLFIGDKYDAGVENVCQVSEWLARFDRGATIPPHIIPNPLTGEQGLAKDGKTSWRADACVTQFKFATIEFDEMPRAQQIEFWAGAPLPIVALIDSGGKSIHGWISINAENTGDWTRRVEDGLFTYLRAVHVDASCRNEARLSRMPGHFRAEKNRWQRILYLNPDPEGAPIL